MNKFECLPNIILRTPMCSFLELLKVNFNEEVFFRELRYNKKFEEALLISSPILHKEFYEKYNLKKESKEKRKIQLSILKYYIRSLSRSTPFGTFSGLSVLKLDDSTKIKRKNISERKSVIYLDFRFAVNLERFLISFSEVRKKIFYKKNTSILSFNKKIMYIERNKNNFDQNKIENNIFLKKIFKATKEYISYENIVNIIKKIDTSIEVNEIEDFVDEMIFNQLLSSSLEPSLEERFFLNNLVTNLNIINEKEDIKNNLLKDAINLLTCANVLFKKYTKSTKQEERIQVLTKINDTFNKLIIKDSVGIYYQIDTYYNLKHNSVSSSIIKDIDAVTQLYFKINDIKKYSNILDNFKEKFIKRYKNQEVALIEALDPDFGIGFRNFDSYDGYNPIIDDIPISNRKTNNKFEVIWSDYDTYIFNKYIEAIDNNDYILRIKDEEIKNIKKKLPKTTDSFVVILTTLEHSSDYKYYFRFIGLNSPNRLHARFSMLDDNIQNLTKVIDENSKRYNKKYIVAEINHVPSDSYTGNVLRKQTNFEYEITYLAKNNDGKKQINVNDLFISVNNNTIYLRSKTLDTFIIPKLSSAHAYARNTTAVYHFLASLDDQNKTSALHFKWGTFKNNYRFHPRVVYKNYILRPAYWFLDKNDKEILKKKNIREVCNWRRKNRIPRYVSLVEGDNHLFIDLNNKTFLELLFYEIKNKVSFKLEEFLFNKKTNSVQDYNNKPLANELIFSFINKTGFKENSSHLSIKKHNKIYYPGDKWMYFKFFLGAYFSDEILLNFIKKITYQLLFKKEINKYFFVRYKENDEEHIRLRLERNNNNEKILAYIQKESLRYINNKIIWKIKIDTYYPEYERYGGEDLMNLSENLFYFESKLILKTITIDDTDEYRVLLALKIISIYIKAFDLSEENKISLFSFLRNIYNDKFNVTKNSKKIFSNKYKLLLPQMKDILIKEDLCFFKSKNAIYRFEYELKNTIDDILYFLNKNDFRVSLYLQSHFHMLINRIFNNKPNIFELLIYNLLYKYYNSERYLIKYFKR